MALHKASHRVGAALLGIAALGTLTACGGGSEAAQAQSTLRFAVTDLQGMEELQREYGAFETVFEEKSGLDLEFFAVTDRTAAAAALATDEVDIVFTGPAEYVVIHERTDAEPVVAIQRPGYRSCLYTTAESGIGSIDELKGAKVAMSDVGSTSGHLGPSQIFVDAGLDPMNDLDVLTVGDTVHHALKRGDVSAVGIGCHDYEEFMEAEDPANYPILEEGELLPPDLLMARSGLDDAMVQTVKDTFTNNFDELLAAMLEGKDNAKYGGAKLIEVTDTDYDVVRSMYRAIGADDFTEFVGD
ncbi:PhnD/SsuA/transferrin family substrate-binding protein [Arthrobacter sulfonylureivorans]|uniref:PhnD/SsuA/transferrin family substrate-binding protein n=1 Tax=Arthrobacter sulfonylureivorans TaxID=2486855 RepID=A0ABY3WBS8_9MICC|nr:PhnD/SsuA/transferrin family substrate-binding protein [Arthrobacter sulfonylureivorans]UNK47830.1 PhnD/SsuA/transferrin family substrate-binding protein [Arthrobacter sulfonylureivorans]